jgi:hypothetical protein
MSITTQDTHKLQNEPFVNNPKYWYQSPHRSMTDFCEDKPVTLGGSGIVGLWTTDGGNWHYENDMLITNTPGKITFDSYPLDGYLYANFIIVGHTTEGTRILFNGGEFDYSILSQQSTIYPFPYLYNNITYCFGSGYANIGFGSSNYNDFFDSIYYCYTTDYTDKYRYNWVEQLLENVDRKDNKVEIEVVALSGSYFGISDFEYLKPRVPIKSLGYYDSAYTQNYTTIANPTLWCQNPEGMPEQTISLSLEYIGTAFKKNGWLPIHPPAFSGGIRTTWDSCTPTVTSSDVTLKGNGFYTHGGTEYSYDNDYSFTDASWDTAIYDVNPELSKSYAVLYSGGNIVTEMYGHYDHGWILDRSLDEYKNDCAVTLLGTISYGYYYWSACNKYYPGVQGNSLTPYTTTLYCVDEHLAELEGTYMLNRPNGSLSAYSDYFPVNECFGVDNNVARLILYDPQTLYLEASGTQDQLFVLNRPINNIAGIYSFNDHTLTPSLSYNDSTRKLSISPWVFVNRTNAESDFNNTTTEVTFPDQSSYPQDTLIDDKWYLQCSTAASGYYTKINYKNVGYPICTLIEVTGLCNSFYHLNDEIGQFIPNNKCVVKTPSLTRVDYHSYILTSGIVLNNFLPHFIDDTLDLDNFHFKNGDYRLFYNNNNEFTIATQLPDFPAITGREFGLSQTRQLQYPCPYGSGNPFGTLFVRDSTNIPTFGRYGSLYYDILDGDSKNIQQSYSMSPAPPYSGYKSGSFYYPYGYNAWYQDTSGNPLCYQNDYTFRIQGEFDCNFYLAENKYYHFKDAEYLHCNSPQSGTYSYYYITNYNDGYIDPTLVGVNKSVSGYSFPSYSIPVAEVYHSPTGNVITDLRYETPVAHKHGIQLQTDSYNLYDYNYSYGTTTNRVFNCQISNSGTYIDVRLHLNDNIKRMIYWVDNNRFEMQTPREYNLEIPIPASSGQDYKIYFDNSGTFTYGSTFPDTCLRVGNFTWYKQKWIMTDGYGGGSPGYDNANLGMIDCRSLEGVTMNNGDFKCTLLSI